MKASSITIGAALLLMFAAWTAPAHAKSFTCSNSTLNGDYASTITGQILAGPEAGPVTGVAITHFDGAGNLTQSDFVVDNGVPPAGFNTGETGTYTLNSDCTGSAVLNTNIPNVPPINMMFVVDKYGREIRSVVSNPGFNTVAVGVKVESVF